MGRKKNANLILTRRLLVAASQETSTRSFTTCLRFYALQLLKAGCWGMRGVRDKLLLSLSSPNVHDGRRRAARSRATQRTVL